MVHVPRDVSKEVLNNHCCSNFDQFAAAVNQRLYIPCSHGLEKPLKVNTALGSSDLFMNVSVVDGCENRKLSQVRQPNTKIWVETCQYGTGLIGGF